MSDEYLPSGFRNVDSAGDVSAYAGCLSLLERIPFFRDYKDEGCRLMELKPGDRVMDAGCGLGEDVFRMAAHVLPGGTVVGFDASEKLIAMARENPRAAGLPVEFIRGDLFHTGLTAESFTKVRIDRVLQHIADPGAVIRELARLLSPGGILLAYDNDWGTFTLNSQDRHLTRLFENTWCDSFAAPWIGRYLPQLCIEAGLTVSSVHPKVLLIPDFETADTLFNIRQTVAKLTATGAITESEGATWIDELHAREAGGYLAASLTSHLVVARKP